MKLLVVEDELSLLHSIRDYFVQEEFACDGTGTFREAINKIDEINYDCIILDINLPDGNGLQLLQYLRKHEKEDCVVIISARNSLDDKIRGLQLGADDYLTKPFHLSELNARVKALLRRKYPQGANVIQAGNLQLNLLSRTVSLAGQTIILTKNEYDLLVYLVNNKNRVVGKQAIAEHIYGHQADDLPSYDFVYSQIKNLKKKLKEKGAEDLIQTIYGIGYKLSI
jgi:DNA-binding response OmpR family regulator